MSWFKVVKQTDWRERRRISNVKQRIVGVVQSWFDDYDEFLEKLTNRVHAQLEVINTGRAETQEQYDELEDRIKPIVQGIFDMTNKVMDEAEVEVNRTIQANEGLREGLARIKELSEEELELGPLLLLGKERFGEKKWEAEGNELLEGLEEPTINWDRLIQQLEQIGGELE